MILLTVELILFVTLLEVELLHKSSNNSKPKDPAQFIIKPGIGTSSTCE
jgi:hypothetical protein